MHVRRALALTAVVPLLLAGCSDEPEPQPKMPDPPPSSSPVPSEPATEEPEGEGPKEFIRRWVEVQNEMWGSGETAAFLAMGPECADCRETAATVDRIYGAGGTVEWDGWKVLNIEVRGSPGQNAFRFRVDSAPTRYRESPDGAWKTLGGGQSDQLIVLQPAGESWTVMQSKDLPG